VFGAVTKAPRRPKQAAERPAAEQAGEQRQAPEERAAERSRVEEGLADVVQLRQRRAGGR
jgi:hypothetical protein